MQICNTNAVWKIIFHNHFPRPNYADERNADERGWREALKMKFYAFINREIEAKAKLNKRNNSLSAKSKVDLTSTKKNTILLSSTHRVKSTSTLIYSKMKPQLM